MTSCPPGPPCTKCGGETKLTPRRKGTLCRKCLLRENANNWCKRNREKKSKWIRDWYEKTHSERRKKRNDYYQGVISKNPQKRMENALRCRIRQCLKNQGAYKSLKTFEYVGCTSEELKLHIEKQFTPEMSWENYGKIWHIDHIEPLCSFDLTKEESVKKANNFSNLRPLLAKDNLAKSAEDKKKKVGYLYFMPEMRKTQ